MIFFLLPRLSNINYQYIDYIQSPHPPSAVISNSLSHYLNDIKERIREYNHEWDIYKKHTNPYEYIHTIIPQKKRCISKFKPLSRSFFKMVEIVSYFKLGIDSPSALSTFHLAEGPGGFIEAMTILRKRNDDKYVGMTILSDDTDPNIPAWKKSTQFLRENRNVYVETGADKTGNILSVENFEYCYEKYKSSMDIITADGGFDFSVDFNNQESNIAKLLFGQVLYAISMQKHHGSFILKIFDSFMQHSIDILAILASFYEQVYITKPKTSRYANSEKYVVCRGFLYSSVHDIFPFLLNAFKKCIYESTPSSPVDGLQSLQKPLFDSRFINIQIPGFFITKLEEYNAIFGQQQIENIHYTLSLIDNKYKNDKIDNLTKMNVQKCINWCMKHDIPYNTIDLNANMFLSMDSNGLHANGLHANGPHTNVLYSK